MVGATAAAIAEAAARLLAEPRLAEELGRGARARVIARYGWKARLAPLDALAGLSARLGEAA
jgi:polysaccharide biosynthesis protein PslH